MKWLYTDKCGCRACREERDEHELLKFGGQELKIPSSSMVMILCATCGNKRCPHANDHRNACTNSNEAGQPGSAYPHPTWRA